MPEIMEPLDDRVVVRRDTPDAGRNARHNAQDVGVDDQRGLRTGAARAGGVIR